MTRLLALAALLFAIPAQAEVTFDWVTVGDPGNAGDPQESCFGCGPGTTFGSVAEPYRISKFEVTNAQYAEFLNAKAASDPNALYNTFMGSGFGGITRSGTSGSFTYSAIAGRENKPVNDVSFYDSLRFANWLNNGQGSGDTETGAYTITVLGITNNTITRNVGARFFLTSEDEWYKAAYYDTGAMSYFDFPAGSDATTGCVVPGATANTANCDFVVGDFTDVGSYTGSASPNGTFDQGGNIFEWNEVIIGAPNRGLRGGDFIINPGGLAASRRLDQFAEFESFSVGFRVASLDPEAGSSIPVMSPAGLLVFAAGLLGFIGYYRRRF